MMLSNNLIGGTNVSSRWLCSELQEFHFDAAAPSRQVSLFFQHASSTTGSAGEPVRVALSGPRDIG
jgi:hypothetical protein